MTWRRLLSLLSVVVAVTVLASACSSARPYAAVVNDHTITPQQLRNELQAVRNNKRYAEFLERRGLKVEGTGKNTFNAALTAAQLTADILAQLVFQELEARKLQLKREDLDEARRALVTNMGEDVWRAFPVSYQNDVTRRWAAENVLGNFVTGQPSGEAAARAYYEEHRQEFEQVCVSHILVEDKAKAEALAARLARGEDFAALARAESKDAQSAPKGGDLGCSTPDPALAPEFLQAVRAQEPGKVGPPVPSPFGSHLVLVRSRGVPPYEQIANQVKDKLSGSRENQLSGVLQQAAAKAKIRVNPAYGRLVRREGTIRVAPPGEPVSAGPTPPGASSG